VVEHNQPGFESHRQQLHRRRITAQFYEAALLQLNTLAASLCNSADKLSSGADSRVTRLSALIRHLYDKYCRDSLEKDVHRSWWETMVTLCRAAQSKGKSWHESHDRAILEVVDSWEYPDWLEVLQNLRNIRDHPEGPPERYSRPCKLQQVTWHKQSKAGVDLIMDISSLRRLFPEGSLTAYSPSIIIELAELLYIQPAPADPADSSRVATNQRQILRFLDPSAVSSNFINTMRKGSPSYSLVMACEETFRT